MKRSLKMQNTSSIPIQIDWRGYVVDPEDKKLIDLNVVYDDINEADLMRIAGIDQPSNATSSKLINQYILLRKFMGITVLLVNVTTLSSN